MAGQDDGAEFDRIVHATHARIRAYIAGMGIAQHEVDDLAQDVYLELYRGLDRVPEGVPIERWLKGIARNLCLNHIRRTARRGRLHREALLEILDQTQTQTDRTGVDRSLSDALDGCCEKLSDENRQLLVMRYERDLPSSAIAAAVNSTAEAIRVALYRIRISLKDCITHRLARERWR